MTSKKEQGAFYKDIYNAALDVLETSHSFEKYLDFKQFQMHVFLSLDKYGRVEVELSCGHMELSDFGEYPSMDKYFLPFALEAINDAEFVYHEEHNKALKEVREQEDYQFRHLRFL